MRDGIRRRRRGGRRAHRRMTTPGDSMGMTKTPGPVRIGDREQSTKILKKFCSWTLFVFGVVRQTHPQSSPAA